MLPLICYLGGFSARPDGRLWVKMSSALTAPYEAGLVRIGHADPNPAEPGMKLLPVQAGVAGRHPPRVQLMHCGTRWRGRGRIEAGGLFTVLQHIQSWLMRDVPQTVLALHRNQCLVLLASGRVRACWGFSEGVEGEILGDFGLSGGSGRFRSGPCRPDTWRTAQRGYPGAIRAASVPFRHGAEEAAGIVPLSPAKTRRR
ncbi:MAG: hypothetical protein IRY87_27570 [Acetobacteraceae bacterium]|nr:hypothetical protein [Acetobacteraceae bacterium]